MKLLKFASWSAINIAWITMSISPVAMGAEAERISKQNVQQYMQEAGLNKKITYGEFWNRTKNYFPGYVYQQMETHVAQNKNVLMPEYTMSTAKATDGSEIVTLSFMQDGKNHTMQFFGEKKRWMKMDNVVLSEEDLKRPDDVLKRMTANDIKFKREFDALQKKAEVGANLNLKMQQDFRKDFSRFKGFPTMTPQLWKSLSKQDRASYVVKMRLMAKSAVKVLSVSGNGNKTSMMTPMSPMEYYVKSSMGDAFAAGATDINGQLTSPALNKAVSKAKAAKKNIKNPYDAGNCIVAGYVGTYVDKVVNNRGEVPGCSVDTAIASYKDREGLSYVAQATEACVAVKGSTSVACNPTIYGYPNGTELCVDRKDPNFQKATHYEGPCDKEARLTTNKNVVPFNDADKDYSNIQPREKQLAAIEADQKAEDFKSTKQYLDGVLKRRGLGNSLADVLEGKQPWSQTLDDELVKIQEQFEGQINKAIEICEKEIVKKNEVNQKGACDQLHRRWLFTERFIVKIRQKACDPASTYIGTYAEGQSSLSTDADTLSKTFINKNRIVGDTENKLCKCNDVTPEKTVGFGELCNVVTVTGKKDDVPVVEKSCPTGTKFLQGGDENQCVCIGGSGKHLPSTTPPEDVKKLCEKETNLWPLLAIGAVLVGGYLLWKHNTKDPKPPVVDRVCPANQKLVGGACICKATCPVGSAQNGTCGCDTIPTPQTCAAPKTAGVYPQCSCPANASCTLPQKIYDQSTCQCTDVPETLITCPDGVTKVTDLSKCPVTPTTPANEGGSGTNPTDNGGYGGVPTGK